MMRVTVILVVATIVASGCAPTETPMPGARTAEPTELPEPLDPGPHVPSSTSTAGTPPPALLIPTDIWEHLTHTVAPLAETPDVTSPPATPSSGDATTTVTNTGGTATVYPTGTPYALPDPIGFPTPHDFANEIEAAQYVHDMIDPELTGDDLGRVLHGTCK